MKIRKIVIATHGTLAEGFRSALSIIAGADNVSTRCCYTEPDFNLEQMVDGVIHSYDPETEELWVFTDLLGGSVNNGFMKALYENQFTLITNTSLGLLMDIQLSHPDEEELREKLSSSGFNAVYCNDLLESAALPEDDV